MRAENGLLKSMLWRWLVTLTRKDEVEGWSKKSLTAGNSVEKGRERTDYKAFC